MKVTNEEAREITRLEKISIQIKIWRWSWIGHVLGMKPDWIPRTALTWAPEGKRKKGSPRGTRRRTVERERDVKWGLEHGQRQKE